MKQEGLEEVESKKLTIAVEQEEDALTSTVLMVLLRRKKFQAPALITEILRGRHCFLIEVVSWRRHFTFGWSP